MAKILYKKKINKVRKRIESEVAKLYIVDDSNE